MAEANQRKKKKNELTKGIKVHLINNSKGKSVRALGKEYNCGHSQVSRILINKENHIQALANGHDPESKRARYRTKLYSVNRKVLEWREEKERRKEIVKDSDMRKIAIKIARQEGNTEFKGSNGWLASMKNR